MSKPRRVDDASYVHFITFSCYHRRRLLDHDQPKRILLGILTDELAKFDARCVGFVIMPDHVHALIWFPKIGQLSRFMQQWKGRSSKGIKEFLYRSLPEYAAQFPKTDPIWQVRFYSFEIHSTAKIEEKLNYMHLNPVRAGLVEHPTEWRWGSARWYIQGRTVGISIQWVD
ncbi:MAG: transposase [Planctomycetaceae bacterium]